MQQLSNVLSFPFILLSILKGLKRQKKYLQQRLDPLLIELEAQTDNSLTAFDLQKIKKYYGYAVPGILGEGFCFLRGIELQANERETLTFLGAATGLYDDLFDKKAATDEHILNLTLHPKNTQANDFHEEVFIKFWTIALANCQNPASLMKVAEQVYWAQIDSRKQESKEISEEEIKSITYSKGGMSLEFYRAGLNHAPTLEESKMLYALGAIMQLENDLFDIWKDREDGIFTLATSTNKIAALRKEYENKHQELIQALALCSFPEKNKIRFMRFVNLILHRGTVCLDCLEECERQTGGVFKLHEYSKMQLICDMEKPRNIWKAFKYYAASDLSLLKKA